MTGGLHSIVITFYPNYQASALYGVAQLGASPDLASGAPEPVLKKQTQFQ